MYFEYNQVMDMHFGTDPDLPGGEVLVLIVCVCISVNHCCMYSFIETIGYMTIHVFAQYS